MKSASTFASNSASPFGTARLSGRILIVEDEPRIAEFLVRGLKEEGYAVEHASDGRTGAAALEQGPWDLVLLDWWLPGEDGIQLLRRFRRKNRSTPVLFLTARDAVAQRVEGLDAGADDYLTKPFAFEELLARVRALLRRADQSTSLALEYADLRVDLAGQTAARAGEALDLTAKEFQLLVFLVRHPRQVVSRTRILDAVWGDDYDGLSNTLEVHVKELRRKLEALGPRIIHTRRGRGYLLDAEAGDDA
jgi:DNA-binding response OmpR family regulator